MRVGVLGSFCSDVIFGPDDTIVYRGPGGIAHSLLALDAWVPADCCIVPWSRVGADHEAMVDDLFSDEDRVSRSGLTRVPGPGYRAVLRYVDGENREEFIDHVCAPYTIEELRPHLERVDAALVNLISGEEVVPAEIGEICATVDGPVVLDLHSVCLDRTLAGQRTRRTRLTGWEQWMSGVDVLQINAQEALILDGCGHSQDRPEIRTGVAARAIEAGAGAVVITRGSEGSELHDPEGVLSIPAHVEETPVDPTGCGDVHGAGMLAGLVRGMSPRDAARAAALGAGLQVGVLGCPRDLPSWKGLLALA